MKIILNCDPDIDYKEEVVFERLKEWCNLNFQEFILEIEGTDYKFERRSNNDK